MNYYKTGSPAERLKAAKAAAEERKRAAKEQERQAQRQAAEQRKQEQAAERAAKAEAAEQARRERQAARRETKAASDVSAYDSPAPTPRKRPDAPATPTPSAPPAPRTESKWETEIVTKRTPPVPPSQPFAGARQITIIGYGDFGRSKMERSIRFDADSLAWLKHNAFAAVDLRVVARGGGVFRFERKVEELDSVMAEYRGPVPAVSAA